MSYMRKSSAMSEEIDEKEMEEEFVDCLRPVQEHLEGEDTE